MSAQGYFNLGMFCGGAVVLVALAIGVMVFSFMERLK